jgi:hypothetical protein
MIRVIAFLLASVLGTAVAWAARQARTTEEDLLPLVPPPSQGGDPLAPVALDAPVPGAAPGDSSESGTWTVRVASDVLRLTPDGEWVDAAAGAAVAPGDQLRTKAGGKLVLSNPAQGELTVSPLGRIALKALPEGGARLRCSEGSVTVAPKGGALAMEVRAGDALVEGAAGYAVMCAPTVSFVHAVGGSVSVALGTTRGQVEKGEVATVPASGAIARQKLGRAVELSVDPPQQQEKVAVISGRVAPGTQVAVGEISAAVDETGRFSARHPLKVGENRITVKATDIAGREKAVDLKPITVAPPAARPTTSRPKPKGGGGGFSWGVKK